MTLYSISHLITVFVAHRTYHYEVGMYSYTTIGTIWYCILLLRVVTPPVSFRNTYNECTTYVRGLLLSVCIYAGTGMYECVKWISYVGQWDGLRTSRCTWLPEVGAGSSNRKKSSTGLVPRSVQREITTLVCGREGLTR